MLVAIWAMLMIWQAAEHLRGRQAFQHKVVDRGRYISTTCGRLLRARSFFGVVYQERLEAALNTLVDTNEVRSVQLLNTNGEALASAGVPFELPPRNDLEGGVLWGDNTVIVENPVDLGTNVPQLVLPREIREELRSLETNRVPASISNAPPISSTGTNNMPRRRNDWRGQGRPYWMPAENTRNSSKKRARILLSSSCPPSWPTARS